jgi:single-strand DNA-binding protein
MNDTYLTVRGWVGGDVELARVRDDIGVATFRVGCTPRRRRDDGWEDGPTTWYTVKAWRGLADHVAASVRQGQPVLVHGRLEADVWTREDGGTVVRYVLVAVSVGHDLALGTSTFTRAGAAGEERSEEDSLGPRAA